jgi:hypothetical protein
VAEERSVDPRGEHGLEPVVQVLTRDPADVSDRRSIGVEPRDALEEQVALLSLQEKGSDVERGSERERLWSRWIQARDFKSVWSGCFIGNRRPSCLLNELSKHFSWTPGSSLSTTKPCSYILPPAGRRSLLVLD